MILIRKYFMSFHYCRALLRNQSELNRRLPEEQQKVFMGKRNCESRKLVRFWIKVRKQQWLITIYAKYIILQVSINQYWILRPNYFYNHILSLILDPLNIGLEACQGSTKDVQKLHKNKVWWNNVVSASLKLQKA